MEEKAKWRRSGKRSGVGGNAYYCIYVAFDDSFCVSSVLSVQPPRALHQLDFLDPLVHPGPATIVQSHSCSRLWWDSPNGNRTCSYARGATVRLRHTVTCTCCMMFKRSSNTPPVSHLAKVGHRASMGNVLRV